MCFILCSSGIATGRGLLQLGGSILPLHNSLLSLTGLNQVANTKCNNKTRWKKLVVSLHWWYILIVDCPPFTTFCACFLGFERGLSHPAHVLCSFKYCLAHVSFTPKWYHSKTTCIVSYLKNKVQRWCRYLHLSQRCLRNKHTEFIKC